MNSCNNQNKIGEFFNRISSSIIPGLLMGILVHQMIVIFSGNYFELPALYHLLFNSICFLLGFVTFHYLRAYLYIASFLGFILLLGTILLKDLSFYLITFTLGSLSAWWIPKIKSKANLLLAVISGIIGSFLVPLGEIIFYYQLLLVFLTTCFVVFVKLQREKKLLHLYLIVFLLWGIAFVHIKDTNREKNSYIFSSMVMPLSVMANVENNFDALVLTDMNFSLAGEQLEIFPYINRVDVVNLGKTSDELNKDVKDKIFEYNNYSNANIKQQYDLIILETFIQNKVITYNYINALWNKLSNNGAMIVPVNCIKFMPKEAKFSYIPGIVRTHVAAGKIKLESNATVLDKRLIKLLSLNDMKDFFVPGVFSALFYDEFKNVFKYKLEETKRIYTNTLKNVHPLYILLALGCYLLFRLLYIQKAKDSNFILSTENYATFLLLFLSLWKVVFDKTFGVGLELSIITTLGFVSLANIQLKDKAYMLLQILSLGCCAIFFIDNIYWSMVLLFIASCATSAVVSRLYESEEVVKKSRLLSIVAGLLLAAIISIVFVNINQYCIYYITGIYLLFRVIFIFTKSYIK